MTAIISPCGKYRYTLEREVSPFSTTACLFIMLNPSTADADEDDPTIRRCMNFALDWGHGKLLVGNLFAFRTPYPRELAIEDSPIGPDNAVHLVQLLRRADMVVCGWGQNVPRPYAGLVDELFIIAAGVSRPLHHLRLNKDGSPNHPLYLRNGLQPIRWVRHDTPNCKEPA